MNTTINLPGNYMDALLSLNDNTKLRIINTLSASLLNHNISQAVSTKETVAHKRRNYDKYPSDIQSLIGVAADVVADTDDERLQYLLGK
jgi:hypothetical protein